MEELILQFVANDESVNRYGYWIRTEGIRTENYLKNPVFLYQHNTFEMSIGKVIELKKEDGKLIIDVEFDKNDEEAVKIYNKYKNGFMSAVSVSFRDITTSDDSKWIKQGQQCATVIDCELLEISAVTLPGNANAVKLFDNSGEIMKLNFINNNKTNFMEEKIKILEQEIASLKLSLEEERRQKAEAMVDAHILRGAITNQERQIYVDQALQNYTEVSKILSAKLGKEVIDNFVNRISNNTPTHKNYRELAATEPETLKLMFEEDFEKFNKLYKAEYGVDYKKQ